MQRKIQESDIILGVDKACLVRRMSRSAGMSVDGNPFPSRNETLKYAMLGTKRAYLVTFV